MNSILKICIVHMGEPYSEILKKKVNIVAANGSSWSVKFRLAILTAKNCFIHLSTRTAGWLLLTFLICLHNQLSSTILSIKCGCLKNVIHQIDCKNEWLLLPARFTTKFKLVFVLSLEKDFS